MKKLMVVGIILLLVGMSIPSTGTNTVEKSSTVSFDGNTLYVGGSGEGNYTKIQDAIDNASDGDTVFVYDDSSPYYERAIRILIPINLIGENKETTIIDGQQKSWGIEIGAYGYGVTISGFTIQNFGGPNIPFFLGGIMIFTGKNIISGNTISNNRFGLIIDGRIYLANNNVIEKNNFIGNKIQAFFILSVGNKWNENYWDNWIGLKNKLPLFPKVIVGFPGINFDWHPAKEPYGIGV